MKFSGKEWLIIILSLKRAGFHSLSLENTFLEKQHRSCAISLLILHASQVLLASVCESCVVCLFHCVLRFSELTCYFIICIFSKREKSVRHKNSHIHEEEFPEMNTNPGKVELCFFKMCFVK